MTFHVIDSKVMYLQTLHNVIYSSRVLTEQCVKYVFDIKGKPGKVK
jgi:hypothetical protein